MQVMTLMNVAMVGRSSTESLAAFSVALAPYFTVILISLCLVSGIQPSIARASGARDQGRSVNTVRSARMLSFFIAVLASVVCLIAADSFEYTSIDANLAARSEAVMVVLSLGMPAIVLHFGLSSVFEGLLRPRMTAACMIFGLATNFLLNLLFIDGHIGPDSAANSAALSMTITRWLMLAFLSLAAYHDKVFPRGSGSVSTDQSITKDLLKFGAPLAGAYGARSAALSAIVLLVARAGELQVSALQLILSINLLITMLANGLSTVATIRVANFSGAKRFADMQMAVITVTICFCLLVAAPLAILLLFPQHVFGILADSNSLIETVSFAAPVAAFLCFCDGLATVAIGILRGFKDGWFAPITIAAAFCLIALPSAYFIAEGHGDFRLSIWSLVASFALALPIIALRVYRVCSQQLILR